MPTPAETFGDYRVERLLGVGSSASVFMAQNLRDQTWVALKVFAPLGLLDPAERAELRTRFLQEANTVGRLRHPDIVALHAAGESSGQLWLAMELAPGRPLDRYALPRLLLPMPVVLDMGQRLAHALAHAHGQGVVHRDIKPSNVLVSVGEQSLKLTDFGTARLLDHCRTRTEVMLGTPAYMRRNFWRATPPRRPVTCTHWACCCLSCWPGSGHTARLRWASCCARWPMTRHPICDSCAPTHRHRWRWPWPGCCRARRTSGLPAPSWPRANSARCVRWSCHREGRPDLGSHAAAKTMIRCTMPLHPRNRLRRNCP